MSRTPQGLNYDEYFDHFAGLCLGGAPKPRYTTVNVTEADRNAIIHLMRLSDRVWDEILDALDSDWAYDLTRDNIVQLSPVKLHCVMNAFVDEVYAVTNGD